MYVEQLECRITPSCTIPDYGEVQEAGAYWWTQQQEAMDARRDVVDATVNVWTVSVEHSQAKLHAQQLDMADMSARVGTDKPDGYDLDVALTAIDDEYLPLIDQANLDLVTARSVYADEADDVAPAYEAWLAKMDEFWADLREWFDCEQSQQQQQQSSAPVAQEAGLEWWREVSLAMDDD